MRVVYWGMIKPDTTPTRSQPTASVRVRLALAALIVPLGFGTAACKGGLTDSPTTTVPSTEIIVIEGRPLRRRNGRLRRARSRLGRGRLTDRQALALGPNDRAALAEYWRNQAELEHASVIAFNDLAHRLAQVEAPDDLLRRCVRAADQEATHAQLCFELAGRYLGETVHAGRLRRPLRIPRSRNNELVQLAVEALRDGVLNEGYAAWLAAQRADVATDQRVRTTLQIIASDEAQHAALSADILTWCIDEGGRQVDDAVIAAANALPTRMHEPDAGGSGTTRIMAEHGVAIVDESGDGYAAILQHTISVAQSAATEPAHC